MFYAGWTETNYVSESKGVVVRTLSLDTWGEIQEGHRFQEVIDDAIEMIGDDISEVKVMTIELQVRRPATEAELAVRRAEREQQDTKYDTNVVARLRDKYGNDPTSWPGMT